MKLCFFYCSGNSNITSNKQFCAEYFEFLESLNTESLDDLITGVHSLVYIDFQVANWMISVCSCG